MNWAKAPREVGRGPRVGRLRRRDDERGASLVEFAFVVPILALLVFGIIDFGMALGDSISQRHGVRDAARQVAVGSWSPDATCTAGLTTTQSNADAKDIICLTKERVDLDADDVRVRVQLDNGPDPYAVGQPVAICSMYPLHSSSGFFKPVLEGKYLKSKVVMRVETLKPGATLVSDGELAPAGTDWTFCHT